MHLDDEHRRLNALERYSALKKPPSDGSINNIAQAAADICAAPYAFITLIGADQQWFQSCIGLSEVDNSLEHCFCSYAIQNPDDVMVVSDASKDSRFADFPIVKGEPYIRFYAGKPLVTAEGYALGTLYVLDREVRTLSDQQENALISLAQAIITLFDRQQQLLTASSNATLEQSLQQLGSIMDTSDNEIYIADEKTLEFLYVNQGGLNNSGFSMAELSTMTPQDIAPTLSKDSFYQLAKTLRHDGGSRQILSTRLIRKNGTEYAADISFQLAEYQGTSAFIFFVIETTTREQIETLLTQNVRILESAPDAMIVYSEEGQIKMANSQSSKLFGYSREELYALHTDILVANPNLESYKLARERFVSLAGTSKQEALEIEMVARTKSGRELPVDVTVYPLIVDGVVLRSASYRDATSRLETERILREAKELAEKSAETKSRFLAAASHDLRQPLQSIKMYLSVLERLDNMPIDAQETCKDASTSLDVMSRILDALLDISELDGGSVVVEKRDITISTILDNVITSCKPHADRKKLQLSCQFSNKVVFTDPALLERILENYVSNAIRYTEQGTVSIEFDVRDTDLVVSVIDSGIGIPTTELDSIFEEYYQLDNHARERNKGLGLGLSVVKLISRLLECQLEVSSTPGTGSTFSVIIPLSNSSADKPSNSDPKSLLENSHNKMTILLVDDDEDVLNSTARLLKVFGMDVHTSLNGDEALKTLSTGLDPDILISDFRLPNYDGIDLVRRVREILGRDLPAIVMSGDTSSTKIKQTELPNFSVLSKPTAPERLRSLIESFLHES